MLLPYTIILRMSPFIYGSVEPAEASTGIYYRSLVGWIESPVWQGVLAILLIFIEAWLLNHLLNRNRLEKNLSSIAGLLYILLMSAHGSFLSLTPVIVANLFVLFGFQAIFKIYKKPLSAIYIFNAGLMFGIASLVFRPYQMLLFLGVLGVLILNSLNLQRFFQFLIGFIAAYYLSYVVFLNLGESAAFLNDLWYFRLSNPFPLPIEGNVILAITGFLILVVTLSYNAYMLKKSIQAQQKIDLFFWLMLLLLVGVFMATGLELYMLTLLAIPLAALLHMNVLKFKNNFVPEFIHFLVLIGILAYHYSVHLLQ